MEEDKVARERRQMGVCVCVCVPAAKAGRGYPFKFTLQSQDWPAASHPSLPLASRGTPDNLTQCLHAKLSPTSGWGVCHTLEGLGLTPACSF